MGLTGCSTWNAPGHLLFCSTWNIQPASSSVPRGTASLLQLPSPVPRGTSRPASPLFHVERHHTSHPLARVPRGTRPVYERSTARRSRKALPIRHRAERRPPFHVEQRPSQGRKRWCDLTPASSSVPRGTEASRPRPARSTWNTPLASSSVPRGTAPYLPPPSARSTWNATRVGALNCPGVPRSPAYKTPGRTATPVPRGTPRPFLRPFSQNPSRETLYRSAHPPLERPSPRPQTAQRSPATPR